MLVQALNRLGICSSPDTLARSIQHYVAEREQRGPEKACSPTTLTIVSRDNIDSMHSYAKVLCGNQASSWHGTTVRAVQPIPSLCEEDSATVTSPCGTLKQCPADNTEPTEETTDTNLLQMRKRQSKKATV